MKSHTHLRELAVFPLFLAALSTSLFAGEDRTEEYAPKVGSAPSAQDIANAIKGVKVIDGVKIELWAAEPHLANPVAIEIDPKGRAYVVETFRHGLGVDTGSIGLNVDQDLALRTVEERVEFMKKRWGDQVSKFTKDHDRLRMIEDSDGDGKADKATVYAIGFNGIPDGLGAGVMYFRGDVYYTCIPHLWKLRDTNGDGAADQRKILSSGYGVHGGYLGHDLHGLRVGPDGKIYYTVGDRGAYVKHDGKTFPYADEGTTWRCNPDGSELEVFARGLRNPQELAFDEYGNLFTGDNNSDGGDQARWVYIVEGGDTGWRQGYQYMKDRGPWNWDKLWKPWYKGQPQFIVPPIANYVNGPSGLTFYPGTGLNDSYKGTFFLANFSGGPGNSGVAINQNKPKGAGFELINNKHFVWNLLATDCEFGPDGALYVSDWINGWGKPNKGRIYKLFSPDGAKDPLTFETKKLLSEGFEKRAPAELVKLLAHADMRVRQGAQFQLANLGKDGIAHFEPVAAKSDNQFARLHAIWGLGQISRSVPDALKSFPALLTDKDAEVRGQAAKLLGERKVATAFSGLVSLLKDENARVRFFAAMALGKLGNTQAIEPLCALIKEIPEDDPWLRHAGVMGLTWLNAPDAILAKAEDASPAVRMAVLLALRKLEHPEIARFLKDKDPQIVGEAARAINDVPIVKAFPALAALVAGEEKKDAGANGAMRFTVEYWNGFAGSLADLAKVTKAPDSKSEVGALAIPVDKADGYASRMTGLLTAPASGAYTFWICADDFGELYLSSDDKPENKKRIAVCENWASPDEWEKYPGQKSQPVTLEAGKKYFVEVLHKEGGGGDHAFVGWLKPDGKMERPIGGVTVTTDPRAVTLRALNANFRLGQSDNAKTLAAFAARESAPPAMRAEAVNMLGDWATPHPRDRVMNLFRPLENRDAAPAVEALKPIISALLLKAPGEVRTAAAIASGKLQIKEAGSALLDLVGTAAAPTEARIEALKALAALSDKNLLGAINKAMSDKDAKVRTEGSAQLAKMNPNESIPTLEKILQTASVSEKQAVLPILARMKKPQADAIIASWLEKLVAGQVQPELQLDVWEAGKLSGDKKCKELVTKYEGTLNIAHEEFKQFDALLKGGDAEQGKKIFMEHTGAQCLRCHKLNGTGGDVGPELAGVATRNPREYLHEAIINPSAKIAKGFEQILVTLNDGKVETGILKGENDKQLTLMLAEGKTVNVAKDQIKTRKDQKQSAMPPMIDVLNKFELRDVIEFLSTLK
ncbi:MAG TPA: PVC-type heme-binding CxxCH protein [Planctomycetota bacterium]|nr:PVC-type heme-binding CxxCH protein [Planctomycetota bacterium]